MCVFRNEYSEGGKREGESELRDKEQAELGSQPGSVYFQVSVQFPAQLLGCSLLARPQPLYMG